MIEALEKKVKKYPNKIAYKNMNESITYGYLWEKAKTISTFLIEQGNEPVILLGEKQSYMIVSMIACLIARRTYVPVSSSLPHNRIKKIIDISKANLIIAQNKIEFGIQCINIDSINKRIDTNVCFDNNIAYMMFTSGSTGNPKCVPISRDNLSNFINWIRDIDKLRDYKNIKVLNQANFNFDLSVADIYYSLFNGHTLIAYENNNDYNALFSLIKDESINLMVITPTFLELCLLNKDFNNYEYPSLNCIYCCGERLDVVTAKKIFARFPNINLLNAYGPTETTSAISCSAIDKKKLDYYKSLPIGDLSKAACKVEIINEEIVIKGNSVFNGYVNYSNDNLYIENGIRCFKTGDLGYIHENKLFFVGRKDNQIKYKGYRIELDEIETAIKNINEVEEACVIAKYEKDKVKLLKAFYTSNKTIDSNVIKEKLSNELPKYMIPSSLKQINEMPINRNGKIDKEILYGY